MIRAGVVSLTERGFPATAIDHILAVCDVPKGSFYHYFESKEAFGLELIDSYAQKFAQRLDMFFLDDSLTPLERLRKFTKDAERWMQHYEYSRGCLVGNLGQQMGSLPESYRARLIAVFRDWQQRTAICLEAAARAREVAASLDCKRLAEFFWIGWEGAVLRAKLERSSTPLANFAAHFFMLVQK